MKTKLLLLLLAASLCGNVAFVAATLHARLRQGQLPMDLLGVDADQRSKLMALRRQFVAERVQAQAKMAALRDALAEEVRKPSPDRPRMLQVMAEMTAIQARMRPKLVAHLLSMHSVLRPAQRERLADLLRQAGGHICPGAALGPGGPTPETN